MRLRTFRTELAEFVRQEMSIGAHGTMNEYVRELIRQRRQARIQADVKFLEEASAGAPDTEPPQKLFADVAAAQKRNDGNSQSMTLVE